MEDFSYPNVCCESNTVGCKQSWRLLEFFEDGFLFQVLDRTIRRKVLLNLVFTRAEEIMKEWRQSALGRSWNRSSWKRCKDTYKMRR